VTCSEPDEILVERARADGEAFGLLYERYVRQIYKYIYYRTSNAPDAEDLTAKVFFQALNNLHRYESRGLPFSAWLFRIAHNVVANWHRDSGRRKTVELEDTIVATHSRIDPVATAETNEEYEELKQVIAKLPADRQQLLFLKFVEDLPNAQIAEVMRKSEGAIKALLHRTVTSMRNEMNRAGTKRGKHEPRINSQGTLPTR
jgi:RNA polymerase sigma-70 factor (ECF subfamily)